MPHDSPPPQEAVPLLLTVSAAEAGLKLLRFLERRLSSGTLRSLLHKWIRSGQVRVNKGRSSPFAVLQAGDVVRLPPFAATRQDNARTDTCAGPAGCFAALEAMIVADTADFLVFNKPGGLACQGGSGQKNSLAAMLAHAYGEQAYIPAPAHRIDRYTSGLVLAGLTHTAQQSLHALFSQRRIDKEYLVWIAGEWPFDRPMLLTDRLEKGVAPDNHGRERVRALAEHAETRPAGTLEKNVLQEEAVEPPLEGMRNPTAKQAPKPALSIAAPVQKMHFKPGFFPKGATVSAPQEGCLLLVRLITGQTHQIRVQTASRGFPVIGDGRNGGPSFGALLLHAHALSFYWPSQEDAPTRALLHYSCPPPWPRSLLPDATALDRARKAVAGSTNQCQNHPASAG